MNTITRRTFLQASAAAPLAAASEAESKDLADARTVLTAGIVRSDGLNQDDEVEDAKIDQTGYARLNPDSSTEAAWAAFIQSLYGSAAFQFIR